MAEDQLAQSNEQDEDKAKAQASKVTFWLENHRPVDKGQLGANRNRLVIVNRSLDPVTQVGFLYQAYEGKVLDGGVPLFRPVAAGGAWMPTLPPCSKITVESTSLSRADGSPVTSVALVDVGEMTFTDAKGKVWHRPRGLLKKGKSSDAWRFTTGLPALGDPALLEGKIFEGLPKGQRVPEVSQPAIVNSAAAAKPLEECGASD
ncbi:hypothetical protein [Streptomyces sp. enrichment culture]|uniref:hypothetical protein n=1 Tax=Streptomyces sp. enrichment culture TaxID=1795815 RepID=UPI003F570DEE